VNLTNNLFNRVKYESQINGNSHFRINPRITGTFIQYTGLGNWDFQMWKTEFEDLHAIGIDMIIIQWLHYMPENLSYYRSQYAEFDSRAISANLIVPEPNSYGFTNQSDLLQVFFYLAEEYGMQLHLGLTINNDFYKNLDNSTWVTQEVRLNQLLAREILLKYGNFSSFAGFYLPYEIFQDSTPSEKEGRICCDFFGNITAGLRAVELETLGNNTKQISVAPYIAPSDNILGIKSFWGIFLDHANVDILMIQDGVGCHRLDPATNLGYMFAVIAEVCETKNVTFWADLEIFVIDDFSPADFSRIQAQIEIEAYYAEKIIIFDIPHYMSNQYSNQSKIVYEEYSNWIK
jgi:hypothetical protein